MLNHKALVAFKFGTTTTAYGFGLMELHLWCIVTFVGVQEGHANNANKLLLLLILHPACKNSCSKFN